MKNLINGLAIVLFLSPVFAMADSLSFTPTTAVFGDATDPVMGVSVSLGSGGYVCFTSAGTHVGYGGSAMTSGSDGETFSVAYTSGADPDTFNGAAGAISCLEADATQIDWSSGCAGNLATHAGCLLSAAHAAAPDQTDVTYILTSPPAPPGPQTGIDAAIGVATSSFAGTFGFDMDGVSSWMWNNLGQPILGSGIGTIYVMRYYWLGLISIGIIVFFAFAYFRFFKR